MNLPTSRFAFALCQPKAENRLKQELGRLWPHLRSAFQRPGLVTFKSEKELRPDEAPPALFARAWGCSAGVARSVEEALSLAAPIGAKHLFLGPRTPEGTIPLGWEELRTHFSQTAPAAGDLVLDVIVHLDEPALVGWHTHGKSRHITPSGLFSFPIPESAPSRAYAKAVEGLLWSGASIQPKETLLEIGASPGGGSLAYLERGLRIVAVDPQPLSPLIQSHPGLLRWLAKPIGEVNLEELPKTIEWISIDSNIAPPHAVRSLRRLIAAFRKHLKGLLLTLKLNDDAAVATLPGLLQELRAGGALVDGAQLPANRGDLFVFVDYTNRGRRL